MFPVNPARPNRPRPRRRPGPLRLPLALIGVAVAAAALTGCEAITAGNDRTPEQPPAQAEDGIDVSFLLSMTWAEAKSLSPQSLAIPPYYKVAADEVKVLQRDKAGRPKRVHAKGRVFLQVDFSEELISLGQESYIESGGELIMRGKPLLQRGRSLVEGLSDTTVFYIKGTRLQVIGQHRLTSQAGGGTSGGTSGGTGTGSGSGSRAGRRTSPLFDVQPNWTRSWKDGPNPLLPALSPDDVPKEMRGSPLLPPPDEADGGEENPGDTEKPKDAEGTEAEPPAPPPSGAPTT